MVRRENTGCPTGMGDKRQHGTISCNPVECKIATGTSEPPNKCIIPSISSTCCPDPLVVGVNIWMHPIGMAWLSHMCVMSYVSSICNQVKNYTNIQWPKTDMLVILEEFLWLLSADIQLFPEFTTVELVLKSRQDIRPSRGIVVQIMIFIHVTHTSLHSKKERDICLSPSTILVWVSVRYMTANCHQIWNCMTISVDIYIYMLMWNSNIELYI